MHALLYKDFRVMWKQMKAFLLLIAIFCLIPNQALNLSAFFVVYAGLMLPMSLMSYDERAKWDTFAAMLPYASREIVLSRYLGGWLCVALAGVLYAIGGRGAALPAGRASGFPGLAVCADPGGSGHSLPLPVPPWRGKGTTLHDDFLCGLAGPGGRLGRPGWGGAAPGQHPLPFGRTGSPGVGPAALPGLGASVRPAVCKTAGVTLPSPPMLVPAAPPISPSAAIHPMGPQPSNCGKISA